MPMRPRSVNSTFEKSQNRGMGMGKQMGGGYATLNPNNRSFQDNNGGGSIYGRWVAHYPKITFFVQKFQLKFHCNQIAAVYLEFHLKYQLFIYIFRWNLNNLFTFEMTLQLYIYILRCFNYLFTFSAVCLFLRLKCQLFVYIFKTEVSLRCKQTDDNVNRQLRCQIKI